VTVWTCRCMAAEAECVVDDYLAGGRSSQMQPGSWNAPRWRALTVRPCIAADCHQSRWKHTRSISLQPVLSAGPMSWGPGSSLPGVCCAERSGQLYVTELGRVASHFYIRHASILVFNEQLTRHMDEARVRRGPNELLQGISAALSIVLE
jgi:Sec63 Brl domain